jgi:hypothetical protein
VAGLVPATPITLAPPPPHIADAALEIRGRRDKPGDDGSEVLQIDRIALTHPQALRRLENKIFRLWPGKFPVRRVFRRDVFSEIVLRWAIRAPFITLAQWHGANSLRRGGTEFGEARRQMFCHGQGIVEAGHRNPLLPRNPDSSSLESAALELYKFFIITALSFPINILFLT